MFYSAFDERAQKFSPQRDTQHIVETGRN